MFEIVGEKLALKGFTGCKQKCINKQNWYNDLNRLP